MPSRHRTLTAWLGLLAIWLAIVGPLASQCRVASDSASPAAAVCGMAHGAQSAPMPEPPHHTLHLDACGYCAFFAHSPVIGTASVTVRALSSPVPAPPVKPAHTVASVERYRRAYARAPPRNA